MPSQHAVSCVSVDSDTSEVLASDSGDDCDSSKYLSESDDNLNKVPAPAIDRSPIFDVLALDEAFRNRLELEFKKYAAAKKRFLLSLIHDDGPVKIDVSTREMNTLRRDEVIVLKDLNANRVRDGKDRKKRERKVKLQTKTSSRENTPDTTNISTPQKTPSDDVKKSPDLSTHTEIAIVDQILEICSSSPVEKFGCDENLSPEEVDGERQRRVELRKLYRWERFKFGEVLDRYIVAPKELMFCNPEKRRERIADSLFKDDSSKSAKNHLHFVEFKDPSFLPVVLDSAEAKGDIKSSMPVIEDIQTSKKQEVAVEEQTTTTKQEDVKKKKKKKRRSSSSSEDLEELERKSEARLGKRK